MRDEGEEERDMRKKGKKTGRKAEVEGKRSMKMEVGELFLLLK